MQTAESPSHPLNFFFCVCVFKAFSHGFKDLEVLISGRTNKQAKPVRSSQTLKSNQQLVADTKLRRKILKMLFWATHKHTLCGSKMSACRGDLLPCGDWGTFLTCLFTLLHFVCCRCSLIACKIFREMQDDCVLCLCAHLLIFLYRPPPLSSPLPWGIICLLLGGRCRAFSKQASPRTRVSLPPSDIATPLSCCVAHLLCLRDWGPVRVLVWEWAISCTTILSPTSAGLFFQKFSSHSSTRWFLGATSP